MSTDEVLTTVELSYTKKKTNIQIIDIISELILISYFSNAFGFVRIRERFCYNNVPRYSNIGAHI